jgi:hypothetical protein
MKQFSESVNDANKGVQALAESLLEETAENSLESGEIIMF